jgi:hypothetical protein
MIVETIFKMGNMVYLKTDPDQIPCIITSIEVTVGGDIKYHLSCNGGKVIAYDVELSESKVF